MLLAGCNTQRDTSSDEDRKQVLWCVGACLFGQDTTEGKETKTEVTSDEDTGDSDSGTTDGLR